MSLTLISGLAKTLFFSEQGLTPQPGVAKLCCIHDTLYRITHSLFSDVVVNWWIAPSYTPKKLLCLENGILRGPEILTCDAIWFT